MDRYTHSFWEDVSDAVARLPKTIRAAIQSMVKAAKGTDAGTTQ